MPQLRKRKLVENTLTTNAGGTNRAPEDCLNVAEMELNTIKASTKMKRKRSIANYDASEKNDSRYSMPHLVVKIRKLDEKCLKSYELGTNRSPKDCINVTKKELKPVAASTKVKRKRANLKNISFKKNDSKKENQMQIEHRSEFKKSKVTSRKVRKKNKESLDQTISSDSGILSEASEFTKDEIKTDFTKTTLDAKKEQEPIHANDSSRQPDKVKGKRANIKNNPSKENDSKKEAQMQIEHNSELKKPKVISRKVEKKHKESLEQTNSSDSSILSKANEFMKEEIKPDLGKTPLDVKEKQELINDSDSSSESEWEEVEERCDVSLDDYKPNIPAEGVEITIDCPDLTFQKRRKKKDENERIRLHINRIRKGVQLSMHKTHLLCLLAHGIYVNRILNSHRLKTLALSLISQEFVSGAFKKKIDKLDEPSMTKIITWFRSIFSYEAKTSAFSNVYVSLVASFLGQKSMNYSEYNLMFIVLARALGLNVRCCIALYPVAYKASNLIKKTNSKRQGSKVPNPNDSPSRSKNCNKTAAEPKDKQKNMKLENSEFDKPGESNPKPKHSEIEMFKISSDEIDSDDEGYAIKEIVNYYKGKKTSKQNPKMRPRRSKCKNYKMSSDENYTDDDDTDFVLDDKFTNKYESDTDDEDYVIEENSSNEGRKTSKQKPMKRPRNSKSKIKTEKRPKQLRQSSGLESESNHKILSLDADLNSLVNTPESNLGSNSIVCWAEIFCKPKKQWIPVECVNNIVNRAHVIESLAPQPVSYIIAIDNASFIKDVTRRYCNEYMTSTLKLRADSDWWEETLQPFLPPNSKLNEEEERKLDEMMVNKPLPTTLQGYKNHPLYVLKRHLLKYEAIYPPDAPPIGFFRSEPVYARDCVHLLHSREKWMKDARVVRIGEEPYKIVKQPRWDKIRRVIITGVPLEIFGEWQTEPYDPPAAVGGKVPRNEYGNVELFKPCMLPKGTVYLQLPGLNRIAKKLDIDCSPALVGFEQNRGFIHPIFDGFVVCEEFKDKITAAWYKEQENIRRREKEKKEKYIYANWKKLIKGLLIRERIKLKYGTKKEVFSH